MAEITLAKSSGFCFGVQRAVSILETELENAVNKPNEKKDIYCVGEIIHNKTFTNSIKQRGVKIVEPHEIDQVPKENSIVFIRTHGVTKQVYDRLEQKEMDFIDATCPFVKKIHKIVSNQPEDATVIIMGDENHPEVQGIKSFAKGKVFIFSDFEELKNNLPADLSKDSNLILVAQTTYNINEWENCQKFIKYLYTNVKIFDTICSVTDERQKEVLSLSADNDLIVVVGGASSSNTAKLFHIAEKNCKYAIHIETAKELYNFPPTVFKNSKKIAITAGASTPSSIIQEVLQTMTDITNQELSFAEMLDQSFKTLNTGERVTGVISAVSPAEIHVDLGTKHTGILPYDEITSDSGVDLEQEYHVGDPIDVICIKFNDVEGTVLLSKKRIDQSKNWGSIQKASEDGSVLSGTVREIIRGGVIVNVQSVKVFVPASQTGIPKDGSLEQLKGQKVSVKIIEINDQRKRAVGSIRNAARSQHKKDADDFFTTAEVGQKFTGTVRSLTNYGAFVNIGPVDGMVHITELSWGRLKPPSELFKIGDQIEVYIKNINPEKKRISLGFKTDENNPWKIFENTYKVDDVVDATIVSLMPFGAFAEIIPGVDGLIHNTQIALKTVGNPASVLKLGDKITAKITAIDLEKSRVSLSIRALLEDAEAKTAALDEEATTAEATAE
ncbi:MAG: 4-hydroxy-3-methylbut-2-enyl diphosphate reductase [Clostridiales bacterium GWF2_36_10]|nr:MAG: 4-hydroxy-3-methylbut-2-enyl diphosphate reductase [Clostridiales bacterium GWF2_36_10]